LLNFCSAKTWNPAKNRTSQGVGRDFEKPDQGADQSRWNIGLCAGSGKQSRPHEMWSADNVVGVSFIANLDKWYIASGFDVLIFDVLVGCSGFGQ
jgi:hypothetical protein